MNTTTIAIILAVVILGGGAYYFLQAPSALAPAVETNTIANSAGPEVSNQLVGSGPLADLFARGESIKCEFTHADVETNTSGEGEMFYDQSGNRFRLTSSLNSPEGTYRANVINDGVSIYNWSEGPEGTFAMKMKVPDTEETNSLTKSPVQDDYKGATVNEAVSYDCEEWNVDASIFDLPAGVEFVDMSAFMEGVVRDLPANFGADFSQ